MKDKKDWLIATFETKVDPDWIDFLTNHPRTSPHQATPSARRECLHDEPRPDAYLTSDPDEVTCGRCLRIMNPNPRDPPSRPFSARDYRRISRENGLVGQRGVTEPLTQTLEMCDAKATEVASALDDLHECLMRHSGLDLSEERAAVDVAVEAMVKTVTRNATAKEGR